MILIYKNQNLNFQKMTIKYIMRKYRKDIWMMFIKKLKNVK